MVKSGGEKALKLLKHGGKPAVEAMEGPLGRLGAIKVLITEMTNRLDSYVTTPSKAEVEDLQEKMETLKEYLQDEINENPEIPNSVIKQIDRLDLAIEKMYEEVKDQWDF